MPLAPDRVRTVTFDSFSTLVDPRSAAVAIDDYFEDPEAMAVRWHSLAVQYATVANAIDTYSTYYRLHRDAIQYLLADVGHTVSTAELEEIVAVYHDLDPFDDVREGLERLHDAGYDLAVVSNGDPPMLDALIDGAGIGSLVDETVSADEIELFKPAAGFYEHAADRLDTPVDEIVHVGAGWGDILGCMHAGMQGVRVDRFGTPWPTFAGSPDATIDSLTEIDGLLR